MILLSMLLFGTFYPRISIAERFPETYSPYYLCSGVVDYDFTLPLGETFDSLNSQAIAKMDSSWGFLNAECKSDMKRLVCATVYLPSTSSGNKRPCKSLCDATTSLGTTCAGMMEAFGTAVNCSLPLFDPSNDPSVCNAMESTENTLLVAQFTEKYIGEVCQGVIEEIAVPSPDSINPLLAPYLPPYAAQALVEADTATWVGFLPLMTSSECQVDFRKMACGLKFPIPSETDALSFLFGPLYMPSFPSYDICMDFMNSCHDFLQIAPLMAMDCNMTFGTIQLFPKDIQTIATLDLGWGPIYLDSSPNEMENASLTLHTQCPYALAVPDDPTLDKIGWIPGFNCAMACPFRCYTDTEMTTFYDSLSFSQWFTLVCTTLAMFNHLYLASYAKRNIFFSITLVSMWIIAALYILVLKGNGSHWQSIICKNNTVYRSIDTATETSADLSCAFFSIYWVCSYNLFFWVFIAMTSELYCRVVLALKSVTYYRYFYMYGSGGLMILLTLLQIFATPHSDVTINGGIDYTCKWASSDSKINYLANSVPYLIIYVFGSVATAWFVRHLVKVSAQVGKVGFGEIWRTYRTLLISCFLFVGVFPLTILFIQPYYSYHKADDFVSAAVDWITCMIINFKSSDDKEYLQICGHYPADRYPVALAHVMWAIFYVFTPLCNIWISYSNEVSKIYSKKLEPFQEYYQWLLILCKPLIQLFRLVTFDVDETSVRSSKVVPVGPASQTSQGATGSGRSAAASPAVAVVGSGSGSGRGAMVNETQMIELSPVVEIPSAETEEVGVGGGKGSKYRPQDQAEEVV